MSRLFLGNSHYKKKFVGGFSVIIDQCLPLAFYMEFDPIYLLGCDCDYSLNSTTSKFSKAYFCDPKSVSLDYLESLYQSIKLPDQFNQSGKIISSYRTVRTYCDAHGKRILNAGYGGKLDVFECINFLSLFIELPRNNYHP
jgi:hypothetical protein